MGREERLLKVLAGLFVAVSEISTSGCTRDQVNSGILRLGFKAHNPHQLRKDLNWLIERKLVKMVKDSPKRKYLPTLKGQRLAENIIHVWKELMK
ncbi:MAG: hypothetical protein D6732_02075 [Methanobacteriota archaeon]|nr:MAG: hypothetical protein D6732_02075 [Euryarchaeota archaeon]